MEGPHRLNDERLGEDQDSRLLIGLKNEDKAAGQNEKECWR